MLHTEEITLLEDASIAVTAQEVTGKNKPAISPFYMLALKVTRLACTSSLIQNTVTKELHQ